MLDSEWRTIWLHSGIAIGMQNLPDPMSPRPAGKFVWQMMRNGYAKHHCIDEFQLGGIAHLQVELAWGGFLAGLFHTQPFGNLLRIETDCSSSKQLSGFELPHRRSESTPGHQRS